MLRKEKLEKMLKRAAVAVLSVASMAACALGATGVMAETGENTEGGSVFYNAYAGVGGIHNPITATSISDPWKGSKVIMGQFPQSDTSGKQLAGVTWNVLSTGHDMTNGSKSIYLYSENILDYNNKFSTHDSKTITKTYMEWMFGVNSKLYSNVLNNTPREAKPNFSRFGNMYLYDRPSEGLIFLPSILDLVNKEYGFYSISTEEINGRTIAALQKKETPYAAKLAEDNKLDKRGVSIGTSMTLNNAFVGNLMVNLNGSTTWEMGYTHGIAPAVNLKTSSVLMTTKFTLNKDGIKDKGVGVFSVNEKLSSEGKWKFTLVDESSEWAVTMDKADLGTAKIGSSYTYEYKELNAEPKSHMACYIQSATSDDILYYVNLETVDGKVKVNYPVDMKEGDYRITFFSEINNEQDSDFASKPFTANVKVEQARLSLHFNPSYVIIPQGQASISVKIVPNDPFSQIYYTLDGSDPRDAGNIKRIKAPTVGETVVNNIDKQLEIKAIAVRNNFVSSQVETCQIDKVLHMNYFNSNNEPLGFDEALQNKEYTIRNTSRVTLKEGYMCEGWDKSSGKYAEDTDFHPVIKPITYNLTYDLAGGTWDGNAAPSNYNVETENFKIGTLKRVGYEFLGWIWDGSDSPNKEATIVKGSTGNRTYKAVWQEAKIEDIKFEQSTYHINVGNAIEFFDKLMVVPSELKKIYPITWVSSDTKVLTVDKNGKVTAVGDGSATLSAYFEKWSNMVASCTITVNKKLDAPVFSLKEVSYETEQDLVITTTETGADIYYTLDGSEPVQAHKEGKAIKYTDKIHIVKTTQVRAIVVKKGFDTSAETNVLYVISPNMHLVTFVDFDGVVIDRIPATTGTNVKDSADACRASRNRKGYLCIGWNSEDFIVPNHDVTYTAQYTLTQYTIEYDLDGGTVKGLPNPEIYTVETPDITLTKPEKDGYRFMGWMYGEDEETEVVIKKGTTGNLKFKADWEVIKVKSIELSMNSKWVYLGESYQINCKVLPEHALTKEIEWTSSNPQYVTVDQNGKITVVDGKVNEALDVTITAALKSDKSITKSIGITIVKCCESPALNELRNPLYNVKNFKAYYKTSYVWGGTIKYTVDGTDPLTSSTVKSIGINVGTGNTEWLQGLGGTNTTYVIKGYIEGNNNWSRSKVSTYEVTVYDSNLYTAKFVADGNVVSEQKVLGGKEATPPEVPVKEGYSADPETPWGVTSYKIMKDTTLNAVYLKEYGITYDLDGGTIVSAIGENPAKYNAKTESFTLINPIKEGYDFVGWESNSFEGKQMEVTVAKGSTGDKAFKACYKKKEVAGIKLDPEKVTVSQGEIIKFNLIVDPVDAPIEHVVWDTSNVLIASDRGDGVFVAGDPGTVTISATVSLQNAETMSAKATLTVVSMTPGPIISPEGGTFDTQQKVTITSADAGSVIYYTTDGTDPTEVFNKSRRTYFTPITITNETTIRAVTWTADTGYSMETSETYIVVAPILNIVEFLDMNDRVISSAMLATGTVAVPPADPKVEGYIFLGWDRTDFAVKGNMTIRPRYLLDTYYIDYELDGGYVDGENPFSYNIETEDFSLKNPVKDGYRFEGWSGTGITTVSKNVTIKKGNSGNRSYTANWSKISVESVILSDSEISLKINENARIYAKIIPENSWVKNVTWTSSDTSVATVDGNGKIVALKAGTTVIRATADDKYAECNVTVLPVAVMPTFSKDQPGIYDRNVTVGFACATVGADVYYTTDGTDPGNEEATSTRVKYDKEFTITSSMTIKAVAMGSTFTNSSVLSGDFVVTGPLQHVIRFLDFGGNVISEQILTKGSTPVASANPEKQGYVFTGWSPQIGVVGDTDVTYKPLYSLLSYEIRYDLAGGKAEGNPSFYTADTEDIILNNPVKSGYTFRGWTGTGISTPSMLVKIAKGSAADLSFTANWDEIVVNSIVISKTSTGLKVGETDSLSAVVLPNEAPDKNVTWSSSDLSVATVDADGKVSAAKNGKTVITVTSVSNPKISATCNVTVYESAKKPVIQSSTGNNTISYDTDSNAKIYITSSEDGAKIYYTTDGSNPADNSNANRKEYGQPFVIDKTTTVKAAVEADKKSMSAVAEDTFIFIPLTISNIKYFDMDGSLILEDVCLAADATRIPDESPRHPGYTFNLWMRTNPNDNAERKYVAVYNVDVYKIEYDLDGGKVDGNNPTEYTVMDNDITLINPTKTGFAFAGWTGTGLTEPTYNVVIPKGSTWQRSYKATWTEKKVEKIEVTPEKATMNPGETLKLTANVTPSDVMPYMVGWKSSDTNIASVDSKGNVIAKDFGTATITAYAADGSGVSGSCTITVNRIGKAPALNHGGGTFDHAVSDYIYLSDEDSSALRYYTTDGSDPADRNNPNRKLGTTGFDVPCSMTVRAVYVSSIFGTSKETKVEYVITGSFLSLIDFVDYDGTVLKSEMLPKGTMATPPSNPERKGYTFTGWEPKELMTYGNTTFVAQYDIDIYTLTYDYDGGEAAENVKNYMVDTDSFALNNPHKYGYIFIGWTGTGIESMTQFVFIDKGSTGNRVYKANYAKLILDAPEFSVKGGAYTETQMVALTTNLDGAKIYYTTDGSNPGDANNVARKIYTGKIPVGSNMTIRAVSETPYGTSSEGKEDYVIVGGMLQLVDFVDYDGTVLKSEALTTGSVATPPANPERAGYTFTGWNPSDMTVKGFATHKAEYKVNEYKITYNLDGGSVSRNPEKYTVETDSFTLKNPTKEGYTFDGWTGSGLTEKTLTVTVNKGTTGELSYTANFTKIKVMTPAPEFSVKGGTYEETQGVVLTTKDTGAKIYYTTDGSDPADDSNVNRKIYTMPIQVGSSMTIRAVSVSDNGVSLEGKEVYVITGKIKPDPTKPIPTGDANNTGLYLILMALAAVGVGAIIISKKKNKNQED